MKKLHKIAAFLMLLVNFQVSAFLPFSSASNNGLKNGIDQLTKYPSKTGPGVTWGISGSRQGKNQCKKLKLRI